METNSGYILKLFVAGRSARSMAAEQNLRNICSKALGGGYDIQVIDIMEQPAIAEKARILATPALIKESPLPVRRLIGDLSDRDAVLTGLGLSAGQ